MLLEKRLTWLRLLRQELRAAMQALVIFDLEAFQKHVANQESICTQLRFLNHDVWLTRIADREKIELSEPSEIGQRLLELMLESRAAKRETSTLTQTYAGLVKRSRRTTNLKMNLIGQVANTYSPLLAWQHSPSSSVASRY